MLRMTVTLSIGFGRQGPQLDSLTGPLLRHTKDVINDIRGLLARGRKVF